MSDILKSLEGIHKQLDDNKKTPDNNVSRDIIKSDASTFDKKANVKATLTSVEKSRTVNVSTVYWETYYKVKKRFEADTKGKTKVSTPAQKARSMSQTGSAGDKKDKKGWSRLAIIAALIAAAAALGIWAAENLGPVGQFLLKLPSKLKGVSKIFKLIGKFLNMLSGGKLGKFFGKIGSFFMGMISKVGKIGKTVTGLFKGSKIVSILKGLVKGIGGKIAKFLRFLPFLGSVISFAFAYSKFKKGKYIGAMFELISGIANLIPGGQIVSLIIDGGILLYDLYESKKEKGKEVDGKKKPGFLSMIGKKIWDGLKTVLRYIPVFSGLFYMGDAVACFIKGDLGGGLKNLGWSIVGSIGGKALVDGIMWVSDLIDSKVAPHVGKTTTPKWDFLKMVWKKVTGIVGNAIKAMGDWVKDKVTKGAATVVGWLPKWVPGRQMALNALGHQQSDAELMEIVQKRKETIAINNVIKATRAQKDEMMKKRKARLAKKETTAIKAADAAKKAEMASLAAESQQDAIAIKAVAESALGDRADKSTHMKEMHNKLWTKMKEEREQTLKGRADKSTHMKEMHKKLWTKMKEEGDVGEKAKVLKIDAVDKLTVRAINATSAGINDAITQSNAYLRQMVDLMKSGAGQGRQSAAAPTIVNSGGSDNSQLNDPPSMIDSRGSYFNSPYSMNVPPVA